MSMNIIDSVVEDIVKSNLAVKAVIQDIYDCQGPMEALLELNKLGREKLSLLRSLIDKLEKYAKEFSDTDQCSVLLEDVANQRDQLTFTLASFRKANAETAQKIEKTNKDDLFRQTNEETQLRFRQNKDKTNVMKMSKNVTEKLFQISQSLAESESQNADSFDLLISSSNNITTINDELHFTNTAVTQSTKLLKKYDRRELTDKVLFGFVFIFFLACVFYVFQKRFF
ncbi:hypothetical protein WDU94_000765 [Cyamophila willieti]